MAKKKTVKVKKSTPKAKAKPAQKPKVAKSKARPRIQSPRSQPLPGMEQVTNRTLNRICEHVSDVRREMARCRADEKELLNQAVTVMTDTKTTAYRFSGVELVLVPGDVHLRVRLLKESSSAEPAKGSGQEAGAIAEALTDPDEEREGVDAADEEAQSADLEG